MSSVTDSGTDEIQNLTSEIRKLKIAYDQYFAGVERVEPLQQRDRVKKLVRKLTSIRRNNTAFKFRLNSVKQSLITYEQYWDRIARRIEEGTYERDKKKAQRRASGAHEQVDEAKTQAQGPGENEQLRTLHRAYLKARSQAGDSRPVPFDAFARSISKQSATIKTQYNCSSVAFRVAVKNGKAILKAVPKS